MTYCTADDQKQLQQIVKTMQALNISHTVKEIKLSPSGCQETIIGRYVAK
jgi:hypothetical protein